MKFIFILLVFGMPLFAQTNSNLTVKCDSLLKYDRSCPWGDVIATYQISDSAFRINGLTLYSPDSLLGMFGKVICAQKWWPGEGKKIPLDSGRVPYSIDWVREFHFDGITIITFQKYIDTYICYSPKYETSFGLRVGMPISKVISQFPGLKPSNLEKGAIRLEYHGLMFIEYKNALITRICITTGQG